jgi:hypothetical protein
MNLSTPGHSLLSLILLITLAACAPQAMSIPTATSQPPTALPATPPSSSNSGLGKVTLGKKLERLSSFRSTFALTVTGQSLSAGPFAAAILVIEEQSRPQDAQRIVYTYTNSLHSTPSQYSEQIRLGNSSFLATGRFGDDITCVGQPIRQPDQWQILPFSYSELGDLPDAHYVGDETLALPGGNLDTRHYVVERSVLGDFTRGHADVWLAAAGGYVAQMQAESSGRGAFQSVLDFEGQITAYYQISQIDQPLLVELPAVCTGDTPLMPGAREISVAPNLIAYQVQAPVLAVTGFYTREMTARQWTLISQPPMTQTVTMLAFTRGPQTANVLFSPAQQNGLIQILVVLGTR